MNNQIKTDEFLKNKTTKSSASSPPRGCCSKWWHQRFPHQQAICRVVESTPFLAFLITLVIIDTLLILTEMVLDFIKLQDTCQEVFGHKSHHRNHKVHERIELTMEIMHYSSIAILSFFVLEILVRLYAFGEEFWNFRRKKIQYFDAVLVIISLAFDLYFLRGEEEILGNRLVFIISFRLCRFVRIMNSVAECVYHHQKEHKRRLNKQYLVAVHLLVGLLAHKTDYIEQLSDNNAEKLNSTLEYFRDIDSRCQMSLHALNENQKLNSSLLVAQFNEKIKQNDSKNAGTCTPRRQNLSEV